MKPISTIDLQATVHFTQHTQNSSRGHSMAINHETYRVSILERAEKMLGIQSDMPILSANLSVTSLVIPIPPQGGGGGRDS